jgi:hypothetical protein
MPADPVIRAELATIADRHLGVALEDAVVTTGPMTWAGPVPTVVAHPVASPPWSSSSVAPMP